MKIAVVKDNKFTGVIYNELTSSIQEWVDSTEGVSLVVIDSQTESLIMLAQMQAKDDELGMLKSEPEYPSVTEQNIKDTKIYFCKKYLAKTDYKALKAFESGISLDQDMLDYRQYLRDLQHEENLHELNVLTFEEYMNPF